MSAAGEKTLETIAMVKEKLAMLDAALNLLNALPDIIKMKAKLPDADLSILSQESVRDYLLRLPIPGGE